MRHQQFLNSNTQMTFQQMNNQIQENRQILQELNRIQDENSKKELEVLNFMFKDTNTRSNSVCFEYA